MAMNMTYTLPERGHLVHGNEGKKFIFLALSIYSECRNYN